MFICKSCAPNDVRWLFSLAMGVSHGPCECCHTTKDCIDYHGNLESVECNAFQGDIDRYGPEEN